MRNHGSAFALCACVLGAALSGSAGADTLSTMSRPGLLSSQLRVLDGRASQQYNNSDRLQPPRAEVPPLPGVVAFAGRYDGPWLEVARGAARRHSVPEDLFLRLVQQESGWHAGAVSSKGAIGLAQLMPGTAQLLGVDPHDPQQNLEGGARYLRAQFERFGTWDLALAAYNAGPEAVAQYGGIPPYRETQGYVKAIWGR
ncbi:lytic transglycosylase domain-containing protein [Rubellimicrobium roseum]|uniref:Lytic transglycosylase domain-containing protein n=1 Tax=Rubellimicrobium roseum TaxID=687525 RepID=A0A5C4NAS4_9RHOB|nr:lytic transglycosylase domain-containing protein [Rubellimicrobium roseum]TNC69507.1 lytic transglycosylase domain-containing protein [Rubellimicrobium roseum]